MLLKRLLAFLIDFVLLELMTIIICVILNFIISSCTHSDFMTSFNAIMFPVQFNIFNGNFRIGMFFIVYEFLSVYLLALYTLNHQNLTIGDKIMKIKIVSNKFKSKKFLLLRFLFRNFFFINVFIFINIIYIILKKSFNAIWYDDILGINVVDVTNNESINNC